jgi:hypothetical protein
MASFPGETEARETPWRIADGAQPVRPLRPASFRHPTSHSRSLDIDTPRAKPQRLNTLPGYGLGRPRQQTLSLSRRGARRQSKTPRPEGAFSGSRLAEVNNTVTSASRRAPLCPRTPKTDRACAKSGNQGDTKGACDMRSTVWISAVLIGLGCAAVAVAFEPGCTTCGTSCQGTGLGAPACAAPFYGTPGCCECPPGPCDNAWEGYCEKKACWQAIWQNVGTGAYGRRCCTTRYYAGPAASCGGCTAPSVGGPGMPTQPSPAPTAAPMLAEPPTALPPAPTPAPVAEQTSRWWSMPWNR